MASTDVVTEGTLDAYNVVVAAKLNALKSRIGALTSLTTTAKGNLVDAINEVKATATEPGVSGEALDSILAALPPYAAGNPLRRVTIKPGAYSRTAPIVIPSGVYLDAQGCRFISAIPGDGSRLVVISGVSDVTVEGGIWDGDKAAYAAPTEHRHNIYVAASSRVRLRHLTSQFAKGDGVYVGSDGSPSIDVTLEGVRADGNHRNGLAIVSAVGLRAIGCDFTGSSGVHPMAGLDVESNMATTVIDDVVFTACSFTGNAQYGIMVSQPNPASARQGGITFASCTIDSNGAADGAAGYRHGVRLHGASHVRFIGGQIRGNREDGVRFTAASSDVQITGTEIARNGEDGLNVALGCTRLAVVAATVSANSQTAPGTHDGINVQIGTGISVTGVVASGASQRYGLRTLPGVSYLNLVGGDFAGNGTGDMSLGDDAPSRAQFARNGVSTTGVVESVRQLAGDTGVGVKVVGDTQHRLLIRGDGDIRIGSGSTAGDTRLYRSAADTLRTNDTFIADVALQTGGTISSTATGGTGYLELREQTVPPDPQADRGRLFVRDTGSGKAQLCAQLGTGAIQILATEP